MFISSASLLTELTLSFYFMTIWTVFYEITSVNSDYIGKNSSFTIIMWRRITATNSHLCT